MRSIGQSVFGGMAATALLAGLALALPARAAEPGVAGAMIGPTYYVTDMAKSVKFYSDGIGMLNKGNAYVEGQVVLGFTKPMGEPQIALRPYPAGKPFDRGTAYVKLLLHVSDAAEVSKRLNSLGFKASAPQAVAGGYKVIVANDPDGYMVEMVELPKPAS